jgi:hypothetical protein
MARYDIVEWEGAWVVMLTQDGIYREALDAFYVCNNRNFVPKNYNRRTAAPQPKFRLGQKVMVVRLMLGTIDRSGLLGFTGTVQEVEDLPNGEFNYEVDECYLNEYMLELAPEPEPVVPQLRDVNLEE